MIGSRDRTLLATAAALLILVAALPTAAQEKIEKRLPASNNGSVEISNVSGSVQVTGWDKAEIAVTGTLGRNVERLDFNVEGRRAKIEVVLPENAHSTGDTDLRISLPRGSRIEVTTVSADVDVDEVEGELELQTVSGMVTVGGQPAGTSLQTVSGDIKVTGGATRTQAETVSGTIDVQGGRGSIKVQTVSGDATVRADQVDHFEFDSVSGKLIGEVAPTADGTFDLNSQSGDIELRLPAGTNADVSVTTFSGRIDSDFGGEPQKTHRHGPGKELEFTMGSGGAHLEIDCFSGHVSLRKR
jgi:DUF4097 and DUF4098 domain-containing protein YvlB